MDYKTPKDTNKAKLAEGSEKRGEKPEMILERSYVNLVS